MQTLKLQENPEVIKLLSFYFKSLYDILSNVFFTFFFLLYKDVPTGELPRNILLSVDRHLVQTIVPGTRLTVIGIYSVFQASAT